MADLIIRNARFVDGSGAPAGGRRLVRRARGYEATCVAGTQTVDHDEFTGELPGRLVRGPQRLP